WRFVLVQQYVAKLAETAINYPPMQAPATFNLDAVKQKIQEAIKEHEGKKSMCEHGRRLARAARLFTNPPKPGLTHTKTRSFGGGRWDWNSCGAQAILKCFTLC